MRSLPAVAFATLISIAAASAQIAPGSEPPPSAFGPDGAVQITTTFRARIEGVSDPRDVPSATAQDTARRTLYNMAANECRILAEYWKADCRMNSLSVYVALESVVGPGVPPIPSLFGTAVYELRPK